MSYSIDWPPGFRSLTCDASTPYFVGRGAAGSSPGAGQRPNGPEPYTYGCRVKSGSRAWKAWRLLVLRGLPMSASEIAVHLDIRTVEVSGSVKNLVKAGSIAIKPVGRSFVYSLGATPVVEV